MHTVSRPRLVFIPVEALEKNIDAVFMETCPSLKVASRHLQAQDTRLMIFLKHRQVAPLFPVDDAKFQVHCTSTNSSNELPTIGKTRQVVIGREFVKVSL